MMSTTATAAPSRVRSILPWTLQILLAAAFLAAGFSKLAGAKDMVDLFGSLSLGQGFRYVTGAIEAIGAILLLVPRRAVWGAMLLIPTMVGAVITHLFLIGGSAVPALVLLVLLLAVLWLRREQLPIRRGT